jgi:hypothetical protein
MMYLGQGSQSLDRYSNAGLSKYEAGVRKIVCVCSPLKQKKQSSTQNNVAK